MRPAIVLRLALFAALLLAVALVQVVKSIDVDRYRAPLRQWAMQATGQPLVIQGKLSLRLSLSPAIEANDIVLGEGKAGGDGETLRIGHVEADIGLMPLLAGEVRLTRVRVAGVEGRWERLSALDLPRIIHHRLTLSTDLPTTTFDVSEIRVEGAELRFSGQPLHIDRFSAENDGPAVPTALHGSGNWGGQHFDASGVIGSLKDAADATRPFPVQMKAVLPGLVATANGTLDLTGGDSALTKLALTAEVSDLAEAGRLLGLSVPVAGAARGAATMTGPLASPTFSGVEIALGRHDGLAFQMKGSVAHPFEFRGVDLAVTADGENLALFGRSLGLNLPAIGPLRAAFHLFDSDDGWRVSDLKATFGNSDVAGHLLLRRSPTRPSIDAAFESARFDFADVMVAIPDGSAEENPPHDGRVFSDRALPLDLLMAVDGDFTWKVEQLVAGSFVAKGVQVPVRLKDGHLNAAVTIERVADGKIGATLSIDATQSPPSVTASLSAEKIALGTLVHDLGATDFVNGAPSDLHVTLTGSGESLHAMMARANGESILSVGQATIESGVVSGAVPDSLASWLPPAELKLVCLYSHFTIADGTAFSEALVADTGAWTIGGHGNINLGREEFDLALVPHPKEAGLLSQLVPLDVAGTLAHPSIVPAGGAAVRGVAPSLPPVMTAGEQATACSLANVSAKKGPVRSRLRHGGAN
jgi:hypothetical protein